MGRVRSALDGEFDRYIARHKSGLPDETIGVGEGFDFQLFDSTLLYSAGTRFVLAGIVNRMDRAYVSPASCGEVRLIYRLTRGAAAPDGEGALSPRLPMTLNVVLKAEGETGNGRDGATAACAGDCPALAGCGRFGAHGRGACGQIDGEGRSARSDPAGKDRPSRNQSSDRACAEIGGA